MDASEISFRIIMLLQICIGVSVNGFLLLFYISIASARHKLSSSDLINAHLTLSNSIILLTGGIPDALSIWGLRNFLDDIACKILIYLYRVSRGLAICTTCLLSVFQAVTISPTTSLWAGLKAKLPKCILPSCFILWIFNLLIDVSAPISLTGPRNRSSVQIIFDLKYCSIVPVSTETTILNVAVLATWDMLFVGLMSVSSGYMVLALHRHHRQVQYLHKPSQSQSAMPEVRAAKRVIALVTLYVLLYGRQSIMLSVLLNMKENSPQLVTSHMVLSFTFSAVSPFLLIHNDRRTRTYWKRLSPVSNLGPS
ncbi:vomeronasal 1 receptor ornAnaV1R3220 isoform X1 [Ornithorhynchus anatinus]|uniref:Vomeronasal type-1 receptor n=1 Tax=Ornithorhynchus anatinus TaxID=9258 RepID=A0A6I8P4Z9_ORNAN|nr:vomeronasal 1 receptor ornAnaV1R3220 [Ornithorhynchus anatinus]XP_028925840.1 vomeronasal 1 receptor ornAnaV1R3220 isoform X1 [Ornithorhynchus anatinus]